MTRMQITALTALVDSAEAGGYTLPTELLDAHRTYTRVRDLAAPPTEALTVDAVAARLVSTAAAAEPIDVLTFGIALVDADTEREAAKRSTDVLQAAIEQAADAATLVGADLTERIITEHLRPALEDLFDRARAVAGNLDGHGLDLHQLVTAPAKVRTAYAQLPPLVAQRRAILDARNRANAIGQRRPQHDAGDLYADFRTPLALFPDWKPGARVPRLPTPEDPVENLLWTVSPQAASAGPWLPTVAEQDAAWWSQFGQGIEMRRQAHLNGLAVGARVGA